MDRLGLCGAGLAGPDENRTPPPLQPHLAERRPCPRPGGPGGGADAPLAGGGVHRPVPAGGRDLGQRGGLGLPAGRVAPGPAADRAAGPQPAAGPGTVRPAGALYPGHPEPEAGPCAAGPPHRAGAGKALGPAGPLPLVRGRTGAAHRPARQQRGAAVLRLLPLPRLPLHPGPVTGFLPQRGAKAPRSRGNPFLPAAQDREPRTRPCGLAHSQRSISLYVSRPSAHVGWTGLF